ncbi:MAG TPA: cellulase family glycosylhydrolase [Bryobacteraceae bacterium]|nr:cellulase family glycosylhydrolase [Bryobacteraceae bacterium]
MRIALAFLLAAAAHAQTPALPPLHVSDAGIILDNSGNPALLRGLNRGSTGSGNADATATDAEYAAQNQLLSMNLVRIFVNAAWWNSNLPVSIAGLNYQDYIDQLIQRAEKYGNYVLVLKAGQFPNPPCGADGKNCPPANQGALNCQADPSVCAAQDTTGANIDTAFAFWAGFAQKYANDPAILYDTWEDMHGIDNNTWNNNQNELIATIRTYSPQSVIFVGDVPGAFEAIVQGALPDLAWSNLVWNFHIFNASTATCAEPASPRYANWPQNFDPLASFAQQNGHAVAITEWGGCNDSEPYNSNLTSYAQAHSVALAYFDFANLITRSASGFQLTASGAKVQQAYAAIAAGAPGIVASVSSANGSELLAPEALAFAIGTNLAPTSQVGAAPVTNLAGSSVVVTDGNGIARAALLAAASPQQISYQVPPGVALGTVSVTVLFNGAPVAFGTAQIAAVAPGIYTATGDGLGVAAATVATVHADGSSSSVPTYQCDAASNCSAVPIDLGAGSDEVTLQLFGTGIRGRSTLAAVSCTIGSLALPAAYAGPQGVTIGMDEIDIPLPKALRGSGTVNVTLTVDGQNANTVTLSFN